MKQLICTLFICTSLALKAQEGAPTSINSDGFRQTSKAEKKKLRKLARKASEKKNEDVEELQQARYTDRLNCQEEFVVVPGSQDEINNIVANYKKNLEQAHKKMVAEKQKECFLLKKTEQENQAIKEQTTILNARRNSLAALLKQQESMINNLKNNETSLEQTSAKLNELTKQQEEKLTLLSQLKNEQDIVAKNIAALKVVVALSANGNK